MYGTRDWRKGPRNKFNPSTIRSGSSILFVGGKRTGKSTVMREFMYYLKERVYDARVFTGTAEDNHPWSDYVPASRVVNCMRGLPKTEIQDDLDHQVRVRKKILAHPEWHFVPYSMWVLEDLEFVKPNIFLDQSIRGAIYNGRHYGIYFLVAFQYVMEVKLEIRGSFDYAVFTREITQTSRKKIMENFAGLNDIHLFDQIFDTCTKDHGVMVIDMRPETNDINDMIQWYKANINLEKFQVGSDDFWAVCGGGILKKKKKTHSSKHKLIAGGVQMKKRKKHPSRHKLIA